MTRPPIFAVILFLLSAVWFVSPQPSVQVLTLFTILLVILGVLMYALLQREMWQVVGGIVALLAVAAIAAVALVQPHLHETYILNDPNHAADAGDHHGFYAAQTDRVGTRNAWTQHNAVLTLNALVHKPITLTVEMHNPATAHGTNASVNVRANNVVVGQLRLDPKNPTGQSRALRFVPPSADRDRTTITLSPATPTPDPDDTGGLNAIVRSITIDYTETWSGVARRMWLLWVLSACAALAVMLTLLARRTRAALPGYAAVGVSLIGAMCAMALVAVRLRVGMIETLPYRVEVVSGAYLACCGFFAAALLPLGRPEAPGVWTRGRAMLARYAPGTRTADPRHASHRDTMPLRTRGAIAQDLTAVLIVAFAVRIVWMLFVPPWLAPDEPEHYLYTAHIVEQGEIPHPPFPDLPMYPEEFNRSVELNLTSSISRSYGGTAEPAIPYYPVQRDYHEDQMYQAARQQRLSSAGGRATGYPPLFYLLDSVPYRLMQHTPIMTRLFAARSGAALLGAASCLFGYLFAYEVRRERRWGWALGMCMALMPMYAFTNATVNNDAAMNLFATALIWLLARAWLRMEFPRSLALAIGSTSTLVLVTKPTAVPVVGVAVLIIAAKTVVMLRAQSRLPARTATPRNAAVTTPVVSPARPYAGHYVAAMRRSVTDVLTAPGIFFVTVCAGYSPYLAFRLHFFKDLGIGAITAAMPFIRFLTGITSVSAASAAPETPLSGSARTYTFVTYMLAQRARGGEHYYWLLVKSFWGMFDWLDVPMPDRAYTVITIAVVIGLLGLGVQFVLQPRWRPALLLCVGLVVAQVFFLFVVVDYFWVFRRTGGEYGLQGRYFFPVLAPFLFVLLAGWHHLLRERPIALRLAPFGMLALQLVALATIIHAYYGVVIG